MSKSLDNALKRANYSSFHMRLAGRLLISLRSKIDQSDLSMVDAIKPEYFYKFCDAALEECKPGQDIDLEHPSVALKIGDDVSRLAGLKLAFGIQTKNEPMKTEAKEFLEMLKIRWYTCVKKQARTVLNRHSYEKGTTLPHEQDIRKLAEHLVGELEGFNYDVQDNSKYRELQKLTLCRLVTFNKRRSGEMQALL